MKNLLKAGLRIVSFIFVYPCCLLLYIFNLFTGSDSLFKFFSQSLSLFPGVPGNYLRAQFYANTLEGCSTDCCIEFGTRFNQRKTVVGRRVYIGTNCCIGLCEIGDDVLIGSNVDVISGNMQHFIDRLDTPIREQGGVLKKIVIGDDSWLGNSSVVLESVGEKSVVAAGAVVVKIVEPYSIVGGNPAKLLKKRIVNC